MSYGSKTDFVRDKMSWCLTKGIISEDSAQDDIWEIHDIPIIDNDIDVIYENPHNMLAWTDTTEKKVDTILSTWNYTFKRVIIPDNYSLKMGCACTRNMKPGTFTLYKDNVEIKSMSYFSDFTKPTSSLDQMSQLLDQIEIGVGTDTNTDKKKKVSKSAKRRARRRRRKEHFGLQ
jgi:hypothetical protein